jgi:hypothetical protein
MTSFYKHGLACSVEPVWKAAFSSRLMLTFFFSFYDIPIDSTAFLLSFHVYFSGERDLSSCPAADSVLPPKKIMWCFVQISVVGLALFLPCVLTKSISAVDKPDLPDANLLLAEFYHTVKAAVNHLVVSRDMHKLVRERRQLNNFGGGNFGQGGLGGFGQQSGGGAANLFMQSWPTGDLLSGLSNVANLASLG